MNPGVLPRIARTCTFKAQRHLLRFAWNGHRAVRAFERRQRRGEPFFPAFLMLSITNRCNLRCRGCWVEQTAPPQELSVAQIRGIVQTAARYGSRFFGLLGGEPLLHPDLFTVVRDHPGAYFQLYTNGVALTPDVARHLADAGNVTPLISVEGLEDESRLRRGRDDVFARSLDGVRAATAAGLFTGVAASINRRNFDELVSVEYMDFLTRLGVHYLWYYIYRPCGADPDGDNALDEEHILALRRFMVEQRRRTRLLLIDAYWDADGRAVCPGAMGLSHHIAPNGAVEFCPVLQSADGFLDADASNLEAIFQRQPLLADLRSLCVDKGRNCILMERPGELADFLRAHGATDSSNRDFAAELSARSPLPCHDIQGKEIPERSWAYRWGKRHYFFGFGAYG